MSHPVEPRPDYRTDQGGREGGGNEVQLHYMNVNVLTSDY